MLPAAEKDRQVGHAAEEVSGLLVLYVVDGDREKRSSLGAVKSYKREGEQEHVCVPL